VADITAGEINGFGSRLNRMELKHADCSGRTGERLRQVENDCKDKGEQITRIFQVQETLNVALAEVKSTIKVWGLVIGLMAPIIAAIVAAVISKYL